MKALFHAQGLPVLQNRTYATPAEAVACPTGDVVLVQDEQTGLIHNTAFDASRLVYDAEYQNEQACSPVFRRHLDDVLAVIAQHFGGCQLVEIGCGKGFFLEKLRRAGYEVMGVDPAYQGDSPNVVKAAFDGSLGIRADAIVLRHVLEHIPDPLDFLAQIRDANGGCGMIYIEVPCFDWIVERRAWFDIFYEHVNYFRLRDLRAMFESTLAYGILFGGQYMYVVADLETLRTPCRTADDCAEIPADFLTGLDRATTHVHKSGRGRSAIWGAASKGVIFSVYLQRRGVPIELAVDINPRKQGRFLPCTGIQVLAPNDAAAVLQPGDNVFVMNSNYRGEIVAESDGRYKYYTVDYE